MVFGVSRNSTYRANTVSHAALALDSDLRNSVIEAFSSPSPDDIVLSAQEQGFSNLEKKLGGLAMNDQIKKPVASPLPKSTSSAPLKYNISSELVQTKKPSLSFVVIGHVDAGKSTLMGRLLYDVGAVDKHIIDKYAKESGNVGKGSFALAWVMDQTEEERNRGVTIDIAVSTFYSNGIQFTIVDAPGHRDFVPNMIAGSSQADVAVLVVDSATNAFESGFSLDGQTKEHAILVRSLGVDRILVAVNKLDTVDWSFDRFEEIRIQLTEFLTKVVGFQLSKITFIPVSGLNGDNVVNNKSDVSWYSSKKTILSELESIAINEKSYSLKKDHEKDFRMIIANFYAVPHTSDVAVQGKIDSGSVQIGQLLKVIPSGMVTQVRSISPIGEDSSTNKSESKREWAIAGDNILLSVPATSIDLDKVSVGDVLANQDSNIESVHKFTSRIVVFDVARPLLPGTKVLLHRGRTNEPCKISRLVSILDKSTGTPIKKKPRFLSSGQTATVDIELEGDQTIPLDTFSNSKELGRFVLRKGGSTIAAGVVDSLISSKENTPSTVPA
ncbi:ribosome dissociation factor GTPase HBS1 [Sugiyamaella lignohabitans]|uniref:Elongation factor 1 alpha-like protein n=1 Tax=Sugiyamaella lignohabitans TaxID=796027 RepID=A0A161HHV5_9ASCO|nr:ribosome dissociation factor GTPase HBS1 [Sugiyamaella lignohabitans]ANB15690.1 ribosome dissociation factor GTPase HBS1 [Sugiyamaella lignohabitans]